MRIARSLLVLLVGGVLLGAVGCEKKDGDASKAEKAEPAEVEGQLAAEPVKPDTASAGPSKPFGNKLSGLLGGGSSRAKKGGMLGELGLEDLGKRMGGLGAPGAAPVAVPGEAGAPPAVPVGTPAASPPAAPAENPAPKAAGGKPCQAVADHLMKIMMKEMAAGMDEVPKEIQAQLAKELEGAKGQIVSECEKSKWPPQVHQCILGAKDMTTLTQCEALVSGGAAAEANDIGGDDVDLGDLPTEVESSGDAECDKLGEHVFAVMVGTVPAAEREMMTAMKPMVVNELSKQCATTPWPKAARACILSASSETAMEKCASQHGLE